MIRAEFVGSDRCNVNGYSVRAAAPVLAMCRMLIEAGRTPRLFPPVVLI